MRKGGEPVASCTRASFRGFLRREAMFIIFPRVEYSELSAIDYQDQGSEGFQCSKQSMSSRTASASRQTQQGTPYPLNLR